MPGESGLSSWSFHLIRKVQGIRKVRRCPQEAQYPRPSLLYLWWSCRQFTNVNPLRISIVKYLNTAPLVRGFTHGPLREKYELSFTVPSQCAEALRTGAADVAIIPAIEYQRIVREGIGLTILPGLAIASKERVRSLLVVSKVPI